MARDILTCWQCLCFESSWTIRSSSISAKATTTPSFLPGCLPQFPVNEPATQLQIASNSCNVSKVSYMLDACLLVCVFSIVFTGFHLGLVGSHQESAALSRDETHAWSPSCPSRLCGIPGSSWIGSSLRSQEMTKAKATSISKLVHVRSCKVNIGKHR